MTFKIFSQTAIFLTSGGGGEKGQGLYWENSEVRTPNPEFDDVALRDSIWNQASKLVGLPP